MNILKFKFNVVCLILVCAVLVIGDVRADVQNFPHVPAAAE
jgi:hypothetical protein